ncbi:FAD:protein FMN transferase [Povalibacter sp.]|uniref:FAD:protein FMN transferase n=1 Tax=Povalibacter sp. TaxID=1962978 RepID=UPI002F426948
MGANPVSIKRGPCGVSLVRSHDHWAGRFAAMACPCDVLIEGGPQAQAKRMVDAIAECAWRIERKFSRYRPGSVVHYINDTAGTVVTVDDETANLLDFAATLTNLSQGRFDITSGTLRRAWTFDGGDRVPTQEQIDALLPLVGWHAVQWTRPVLRLRPGMQIDLGGIGKEYAVDAAAAIANTVAPGVSCLVNFGGDVAVVNARSDGQPWRVGIEKPDRLGTPAHVVQLYRGGIATSGDSRRFVLSGGQRYSHILDARTGWPVRNAPHSVTVTAETCTQAGSVTTLAMLQGENADAFLKSSGMDYWLQ